MPLVVVLYLQVIIMVADTLFWERKRGFGAQPMLEKTVLVIGTFNMILPTFKKREPRTM